MNDVKKINITRIMTSTGLRHYLGYRIMSKIGVLVVVAMVAQSGQAACPNVQNFQTSPEIKNVNTLGDYLGTTIYFCKQLNFTANDLTFAPTPEELLAGGSQAISLQNNSIQSFPITTTSINMMGINPTPLTLNLTEILPKTGGQYSDGSIFNFYSWISEVLSGGDCYSYYSVNQYDRLKTYLSDNAEIFQATSAAGTVSGVSDLGRTADSIVKIENVKFTNATGGQIEANVFLYHSNDIDGRWFTRGSTKYCWLGVRAEVVVSSDSNLKAAGDYDLNLSVLTR